MKRTITHLTLLFLLLLVACRTGPAAPPPLTPTAVSAAATTSPTNPSPSTPSPLPISFTILYTNDEHGWMEGQEIGQSAANLMGLWQENTTRRPPVICSS
ncbi:MAG: hypothetical protein IPL78_23620 [Chloroflexi bacterium]|nr:hypothetical protein [Chloroflexota bacterium]